MFYVCVYMFSALSGTDVLYDESRIVITYWNCRTVATTLDTSWQLSSCLEEVTRTNTAIPDVHLVSPIRGHFQRTHSELRHYSRSDEVFLVFQLCCRILLFDLKIKINRSLSWTITYFEVTVHYCAIRGASYWFSVYDRHSSFTAHVICKQSTLNI